MDVSRHSDTRGRLGRVLIVDDEAQIRKPISLNLAKAGYEVVEAEDGEQAIRTLGSDDHPLMVDAILCDIRMPKINGTDAITFFRAQYPGVPVVVLTGYPDLDMAVSLMKQGVLDYLVKPVSKEELLRVIAKSVDQHMLFSSGLVV